MVTKKVIDKIEDLANRLDKFNDSQIILGGSINASKISEFGILILEAQQLGFNVEIPRDVVMNLNFGNKKETLVVFDCDSEKAYVNTTGLWDFIHKRKRFKVV